MPNQSTSSLELVKNIHLKSKKKGRDQNFTLSERTHTDAESASLQVKEWGFFSNVVYRNRVPVEEAAVVLTHSIIWTYHSATVNTSFIDKTCFYYDILLMSPEPSVLCVQIQTMHILNRSCNLCKVCHLTVFSWKKIWATHQNWSMIFWGIRDVSEWSVHRYVEIYERKNIPPPLTVVKCGQ